MYSVCFIFFSNCPAGKNFLGYYIRIIDRIHIQSSLAFMIVFSRERRGEIPHPPEKKFGIFLRGDSSQFGKKKHCQGSLRSSNFFSPNSLHSPKVCLQAARSARQNSLQRLASLVKFFSPKTRFARQKLSARLASLAVFAHMCARCEA